MMNNSILYIKKIYPEIYTITIKYSSIINQMLQMLQMLQLLQMLQMLQLFKIPGHIINLVIS